MPNSKLWRALLVLVAGASASVVAAPAHADATGWALVSAYSFPDAKATTGQSRSDTIVRVTFDVPDNLTTLHYEVTGGAVESGDDSSTQGHMAIDVAEWTVSGSTALDPITFTFSKTEGSQALWTTTVSTATPARPTSLTVNPVAAGASAGASIRVSGTLTQGGAPLVGHWVQIIDLRRKPCAQGSDCEESWVGLGQAQVDRTGHWKAAVPVNWTSHLVVTYCSDPSTCWGNPNSPAFANSSTVTATWAPKLRLPRDVRANRTARYSITIPAAVTGLAARLQARMKGTWKTIAKTTVTTSATVVLHARLGTAGRVRLRAYVPGHTYNVAGQTGTWDDRHVNGGYSRTGTVHVSR